MSLLVATNAFILGVVLLSMGEGAPPNFAAKPATCPKEDLQGASGKDHIMLQTRFRRMKQTALVAVDAWAEHQQLPSSCQSVLTLDAGGMTCSQRLTQLQGSATDPTPAMVKLSLQYTNCAPCWPWQKYKSVGDTTVSKKRGIALQNVHLAGGSLQAMVGTTSWGYGWSYKTESGGPTLSDWQATGISFVPMVWGTKQIPGAQSTGLPLNSQALLGFNEPNFPTESNLLPAQAAALWPQLTQLAAAANISKIVSPAVNFAQIDPVVWLTQFFGNCTGCKVDAVAIHSYTCYGRYLQNHLAMYKAFGKPLWLTEFACSDSVERQNMTGQMAYMKEAIPLLESDPMVERYAWFSYFQDQWGRDAGLVRNGVLSQLGTLYKSFAGAPLTKLPPGPTTTTTTTTTTVPACHTAISGEKCYTDITWAKQTGITLNPATYPGLTAASSLADFQTFFYTNKINSGSCPWPPCRTATTLATGTTSTMATTTITTTTTAAPTTTTTSAPTTTKAAAPTTTTSAPTTTPACHTTVSGEKCYTDITWAKQTGITLNPATYPGLTAASSLADFQTLFYSNKINSGSCPWPPCPLVTTVAPATTTTVAPTTRTTTTTLAPTTTTKATTTTVAATTTTAVAPTTTTAKTTITTVPPTTTVAPTTTAAVACHTAVVGETCYNDITWAKSTGTSVNPAWYPGLNASSPLNDFQMLFYTNKVNGGSCPWPPCLVLVSTVPTTSAVTCHTAISGDTCYTDVTWAMKTGITVNPAWYPGLTASSSFYDFQMLFYTQKTNGGSCPWPPCTSLLVTADSTSQACHTAVAGESCFADVVWSMGTGIHVHPEWYPGLTAASSFYDFQMRLFVSKMHGGSCPLPPCGASPSEDTGDFDAGLFRLVAP